MPTTKARARPKRAPAGSPDPGEAYYVPEYGDERYKERDQEQAVPLVGGDTVPESAFEGVYIHLSRKSIVGYGNRFSLGADGLEVLALGKAHRTGEDHGRKALYLGVVALHGIVVVLPGE